MKPYDIDDKGLAILEVLAENSRLNPEEIAGQLEMDTAEVEQRIAKLEKDRIILGYSASINWQRVRHQEVRALIEVKVTPERNVGFDAMAEAIYRFPEVSSVHLLSGAYDLLVQITGENLKDAAFFVSEKLATIKGVQSTVSHFLLKTYKDNGMILVDQEQSKRLPVSP